MNARNVLLAAMITVALTACGTLRRAGKDVFVGVTSPYLILAGGATDGYASSSNIRDGLGGSAVEVLSFPFTFLYHGIGHTIYCALHVLDLPLCALYMFAEFPPANIDIRPLDYYQGTWFDTEADKAVVSGTDATSGESVPPNAKR